MSVPPYELSECGFGSFLSKIEFHFHNNEKAKVEYDLALPDRDESPLENSESGHFSFENPSEDFKGRLLRAGGIITPSTPSSTSTGRGIVPRKRAAVASKKNSKVTKKKKKQTVTTKSGKCSTSFSDSNSDTSDVSDASDKSWTEFMYTFGSDSD